MKEDLTLYLLACSKTKAAEACQARDLYQGQLFTLCRAYVEKQGAEYDYLILSAYYGLLSPDEEIFPYEKSLCEMTRLDRIHWANWVWQEGFFRAGLHQSLLRPYTKVVFLAGEPYREFLTKLITSLGIPVEVPMEGLGIGEQKAWLLQALRP